MKKKLIILALLVLVAAPAAFSWGVGLAYSTELINSNLPANALLTVKANNLPFVLGASLNMGGGEFQMGITADWWLYHAPLAGAISWYIGPGIYLAIPEPIGLGVRLPVGFQVFPLDPLEIFLELALAQPLFNSAGQIQIPDVELQAAVGFRFWF